MQSLYQPEFNTKPATREWKPQTVCKQIKNPLTQRISSCHQQTSQTSDIVFLCFFITCEPAAGLPDTHSHTHTAL